MIVTYEQNICRIDVRSSYKRKERKKKPAKIICTLFSVQTYVAYKFGLADGQREKLVDTQE